MLKTLSELRERAYGGRKLCGVDNYLLLEMIFEILERLDALSSNMAKEEGRGVSDNNVHSK